MLTLLPIFRNVANELEKTGKIEYETGRARDLDWPSSGKTRIVDRSAVTPEN